MIDYSINIVRPATQMNRNPLLKHMHMVTYSGLYIFEESKLKYLKNNSPALAMLNTPACCISLTQVDQQRQGRIHYNVFSFVFNKPVDRGRFNLWLTAQIQNNLKCSVIHVSTGKDVEKFANDLWCCPETGASSFINLFNK